MQQVGYGAKRCQGGGFKWRGGGVQVRPRGWDERARTIGQDENQIQLALTPHPTQEWELLPFEWVARSDNGNRGWIPLEVSSV